MKSWNKELYFSHFLLNQNPVRLYEENTAGFHTWLLSLHEACSQEPRWDISSTDRLSSGQSSAVSFIVQITGLNIETLMGLSTAQAGASEPKSN